MVKIHTFSTNLDEVGILIRIMNLYLYLNQESHGTSLKAPLGQFEGVTYHGQNEYL